MAKYGANTLSPILVAVYTTDVISEVRVYMLSIYIRRRGLKTKTFTSTNKSCNIVKICVLKRSSGFTKIECRTDIRGTDDILKVGVYMSSIWIHRRGLMIKTSYITETSHGTSTKCVLMRHLLS